MQESSLYYRMKREEEAKARRKKRRKNSKILRFIHDNTIILVVCTSLLAVFGVFLYLYYPYWMYEKAVQQIEQGQYRQALEYLEPIEDKRIDDTWDLITLCESCIYYEQGKIELAYDLFRGCLYGEHFEHQTEEQKHAIDAYEAELRNAYRPIAEEQERKKRSEAKKYLEEIRSGFPFVGMHESFIGDTCLGAPSPKTRVNKEVINGKQYSATIYDFVRNDKVIFTARCVQGRVTEVWDKRDNVSHGKSECYSSLKESDPYNASDYRTAEAFYDANYDKFFCFEDAESYYYEHRNE